MWPLATKTPGLLSGKLNIFYMHSLSFCMHSFICLVHISHTCNLCHNHDKSSCNLHWGEILLLNLPPVLGFTQRKLVRRCEIAGNLVGRYNWCQEWDTEMSTRASAKQQELEEQLAKLWCMIEMHAAAAAPRTACLGTATKAGRTVWPAVGGTAATEETAHETAARGRGADRCSQRRPQGCTEN